jgi:hypothetical protein
MNPTEEILSTFLRRTLQGSIGFAAEERYYAIRNVYKRIGENWIRATDNIKRVDKK